MVRLIIVYLHHEKENIEDMKPQFLVGAVSSDSGKTLFVMGLLRLLRKRDLKVQSYKTGPNFMDAQLHALANGVESVNLDSFLSSRTRLQLLYNTYGEKADICITEGSAALFDGYKRLHGSNAELAQILSTPVVLIVNARSAAYSLAPILYGFKNFISSVHFVGVVFNQVSSPLHYSYLKDACNDAGLQCLGYIPYDETLRLPACHTSLTQTVKVELESVIEKVASYINEHVDVDRILKLSTRIFPCPYTLPYTSDIETEGPFIPTHRRLKIAIARDAAFNFIYKENLDCLSREGNVQFFSPLYSNELPDADFIYLPGGYPELFARQLHRRKSFLQQLKTYVERGGKVWAEGGGMILLSRSLTIREGGSSYEMSGALPIDCTMIDTKLQSGYRCTKIGSSLLNGHEFRYFRVALSGQLQTIPVFNIKGIETHSPMYRYKNVIAGCVHWEWGRLGLGNFF